MPDLQDVLSDLRTRYADLRKGGVASYIPELAKANRDWFGIAVVGVDGQGAEAGDTRLPFTMQSLSKPFVYGLALERLGREAVLEKVGVEPTGDPYNSVIRLDEGSFRPHNPMINAGAIAVTDMVAGNGILERLSTMRAMFRAYAGHDLTVDLPTYLSERSTGHRNHALAYLLLNFGMIEDNVQETLDLYFQQCSLLATCHDLAVMAATLANGGVNPVTGERAIAAEHVQDILSVMFTCGLYDHSGEWAATVGLPAKSGVSGGIIAVAPGRYGIAVFSPPVDAQGNSVRGVKVCEDLSREFGLHVFGARRASAED